MYLDHFGLNESPFRITPHTDFFFAGANRGATLEALLYAITHDEGIVKVSGEVGTGKTMLCRVLMERLPPHVETIFLANPSLSRDEILFAIADELKLDIGSERSTRVLRSIQDALIERYAAGKRVVVLIDEAHAMPRETLEEIRLLSNLETNRNKLLQIVLFGQPELDELLGTVEMRQLKERITHGFRLEPLVRNDIASYIEYRMRAAGYRGPNPFSAGAVRRIADASKGLTRRVNILADKALLAAFAADTHSVGEREAKRAVSDSDFYRPLNRHGRITLVLSCLSAGLVLGYALGVWLPGTSLSPPISPITSATRNAATAEAAKPALAPIAQATADQTQLPFISDTPVPAATPANSGQASTVVTATMVNGKANPQPAEKSQDKVTPLTQRQTAPKGAAETHIQSGPAGLGPRAKKQFAVTQEWLKEAPGKSYAIQLLTVTESESRRLESFLARAEKLLPDEELRIYSVKINDIQNFRVAMGSYISSQEARNAIAALPPDLKTQNPYFRSVERMRSKNSQ